MLYEVITDLGRLAAWLAEQGHEALLDIRETTLTGFIAHLSRHTRATSQSVITSYSIHYTKLYDPH